MHPQSERAIQLWSQGPAIGDPDFSVEERRLAARMAGLAEDREEVAAVEDLIANAVPVRLYRPSQQGGAPSPVLVHLHGGGFVFGDLETHDAHCRRLVNRTGRTVVAVDYRRAPEAAYPAASDDVDLVIEWLRTEGAAHGLGLEGLAVIGDSAGGHLAAVAVWRHPGLFAKAVLVYPCLSPENAYPSYQERTGGLDAFEMDWYWDAYAPAAARGAAELRLGEQHLAGFAPTLVLTAEHDPLVDEGEAFAARLVDAGVPCTATRYPGMIHGFYRWGELFDASDQALREVAAFLQGGTPSPTIKRS